MPLQRASGLTRQSTRTFAGCSTRQRSRCTCLPRSPSSLSASLSFRSPRWRLSEPSRLSALLQPRRLLALLQPLCMLLMIQPGACGTQTSSVSFRVLACPRLADTVNTAIRCDRQVASPGLRSCCAAKRLSSNPVSAAAVSLGACRLPQCGSPFALSLVGGSVSPVACHLVD